MKHVPTLLYGTAWKEQETARLTALALRAGFRGIDTANQRKHYFEAGVGEGLAEAIGAGVVRREDVFVQTKFTYARGQDHRLPYDGKARPADQVRQSFERSLEHLRTDTIDSLVLHGPEQRHGLSRIDEEVWAAMGALVVDGRVRHIGVSNVAPDQLEALFDLGGVPPTFVQNRCYASHGWDAEVRAVCRDRGVTYQGFSLLTANRAELLHPDVVAIASRVGATVPQVVFRFSQTIGIVPLTGTSDPVHMREDLAAADLALDEADVDLLLGISSR